MGGPLSSSSSGHNMHENETQNQNHQQNSSSQAQNHQTTGKNEFQTIGRLSPNLWGHTVIIEYINLKE